MTYDPNADYYTDRTAFGGPSKPKRPWWVLPAAIIIFAAVGGVVISAVTNGGENGRPVRTVTVEPVKGLPPSEGPLTPSVTPGGYCTTSQLTRRFVTDGVTYTCGGPKPYRWLAGAK